MSDITAAAAWYPDPLKRHELRYWDGQAWTEHVASEGHQGIDPQQNWVATPTTSHSPAGWHPDPSGHHEQRYWDGIRWTDHVYSRAQQPKGPQVGQMAPPHGLPIAKIARQAREAGAVHHNTGGGTIFTEQVLVVNQKARVLRTRREYAVYGGGGHQVGRLQELRPRFRHRRRVNRDYRFQLVDMRGQVLLALTRPRARIFTLSGRLVIDGPGATPIGEIVHEPFSGGAAAAATQAGVVAAGAGALLALGPVLGPIAAAGAFAVDSKLSSAMDGYDRVFLQQFALEADGQRLGSILSRTSKAWDFAVLDQAGAEVAQITKTWAGWLKERYTTADNYVVEMHQPLGEPLRSLVIAAALAIDVELKESGDQTTVRRRGLKRTRTYK